jgi:hypothetical protein
MVRNDILKFRTDPRPWTPRAKICLAQPATRSYRGWAAYAELLAGRAAHNSKVGQHMTSAKGLDISEPADSFEIATRRMSVIRPVCGLPDGTIPNSQGEREVSVLMYTSIWS